MNLEEKKDLCSRALIGWLMNETNKKDMSVHDKEVEEIFTSKILLKKFDAFDIDIVLPDMLLVILDICVEGNPGQVQIVLKDLLNHIKKTHGPIPKGYVIKSWDFCECFANSFPFMDIPEINEKYRNLWDAQKKPNAKAWETDNLCDTPEWWKEVME